ncbi:MAG TPA: hypothetical protein VG099_13180 [Gemmataceae bacterium]|jgi:hypothetical protein|nr:hypothetical protein [Gemmataceae bacterium]
MLGEARQKEAIREYLHRKFGPNVPADEAAKYSVGPLSDRPNWYGIYKVCDLSQGHGHLEPGTEWMEGGDLIPGVTVRAADVLDAKDRTSQFLGRSKK